jgi:uncharacterized membrane protein YqgA involved in biofilm formation
MTGTILNVATVLIGGTAGTILGDRLPPRVRETVVHALGLATLTIGMSLAIGQLAEAEQYLSRLTFLVALASLLGGAVLGEVLGIDEAVNRLGQWLEGRIQPTTGGEGSPFSRGFVTASLVFCVGPLTLIGCFQDGLTGDYTLLAIKSTLDGFAALAFASSMGVGVNFAALTVLIYQGGLTLGAGLANQVLTPAMIAEMSATGGMLILAIGLGLLDIKRIRVANLLPAIFLAPPLTALAAVWVPYVR